jgi:diguanylate cyclase (GGDEF)-like protein
MGVVFADMNGLKYTNDHLGHVAGDQLLKNAAVILQSTFVGAEIFRAGGDEFLILMHDTTEEDMKEKINEIRKKAELFENVSFAAGGCLLQPGMDLRDALSEADAQMYRDKGNFYRKYPEPLRPRCVSWYSEAL